MVLTKQFMNEFLHLVDILPDNKIVELYDFARFLAYEYPKKDTQIDEASLRVQEMALKNIWEDPEEDIYEL